MCEQENERFFIFDLNVLLLRTQHIEGIKATDAQYGDDGGGCGEMNVERKKKKKPHTDNKTTV